jgi:hypothetical protein
MVLLIVRPNGATAAGERVRLSPEPFTVGQYWGDSDQANRKVKTLTDYAWARLQQIRAKRDPDGLFADYLAGPSGFRNLNGWENGQ